MTINKAQGQTIPTVGVYLPEPVFSHGQLYVALSRATAAKNIKVLTADHDEEEDKQETNSKSETCMKNKKKRKNISTTKSDTKNKRQKTNSKTETYTKNIVYSEVLTN